MGFSWKFVRRSEFKFYFAHVGRVRSGGKLKLDVMKERLPRRASLINSGARRTVDRCGRRL
jgi:hypothetical protein